MGSPQVSKLSLVTQELAGVFELKSSTLRSTGKPLLQFPENGFVALKFIKLPLVTGHLDSPFPTLLHGFLRNSLQMSFSKVSFLGNSGNNPTTLPARYGVSSGAVKLITIRNDPEPNPYLPKELLQWALRPTNFKETGFFQVSKVFGNPGTSLKKGVHYKQT